MKKIAAVVGIILVLVLLVWGGIKFRRWAHYSWFYSDQVQSQIEATYEKRIKDLEQRVKELEGQKGK